MANRMYTIDGEEVEVVASVGDKYIVRFVFEYDGEDDDDLPRNEVVDERDVIIGQVFQTPPTKKISEEYASLKKSAEEMEAKIAVLESTLSQKEYAVENLFAEFGDYLALTYLRDFLAGKMTHILTCDRYKAEIKPLKEYGEFPVLKLVANRSGGMVWKKDDKYDVTPFASYEEAREALRKHLDYVFGHEEPSVRWVEIAREHKIEVPAWYMAKIGEGRKKYLLERMDDLRKSTISAENELAEIEAQLKQSLVPLPCVVPDEDLPF